MRDDKLIEASQARCQVIRRIADEINTMLNSLERQPGSATVRQALLRAKEMVEEEMEIAQEELTRIQKPH
ncbi:hypothetical protein [Terrihabitans rhizophilus]|uniref:hypothetical protein n=1 Tax=Terrihabitans rhizophilus TaxID=3092662 RepID=UPI0029DE70E8|nr:hypothetical protein [Terrihabitans sp. PJ23]